MIIMLKTRLLVAAVLAISAVAAGASSTASSAAPSVSAGDDLDVQLDNAVQSLHDALGATDPDLTAVIADHNNHSILITTASAADKVAAAATSPFPIAISTVPYSFAQLEQQMSSAPDAMDSLASSGIKVRSIG